MCGYNKNCGIQIVRIFPCIAQKMEFFLFLIKLASCFFRTKAEILLQTDKETTKVDSFFCKGAVYFWKRMCYNIKNSVYAQRDRACPRRLNKFLRAPHVLDRRNGPEGTNRQTSHRRKGRLRLRRGRAGPVRPIRPVSAPRGAAISHGHFLSPLFYKVYQIKEKELLWQKN